MTKKCSKCGQLLPLASYYSKRGGLDAQCKDCVRSRVNSYRGANHQTVLASKKAYRLKNGESVREGQRRHYQKNRLAIQVKNAAYYRANFEAQSLWKKDWLRANRDKDAERGKRRRARRAGASRVDFTTAEWKETLDYFGSSCGYCLRSDVPLEREHLWPLVRGGEHTAENIIPACRECNAKKGGKDSHGVFIK